MKTATITRPPGRRSSDRALAAQQAVARVLADAQTIRDAAPEILQGLGRALGWPLAALWEVDESLRCLRCVEFWQMPETSLDGFESATRRITIPFGVGLPGQVWAGREPVWISDLSRSRNHPRALASARSGLRCGLGLPLRAGQTIYGVVELYATQPRQPDEDLIQMLAVTGGHIGQFIKQKRVEESLRENEEQYRLLFAGVSEAIVVYENETRRIVDVNDAALGLYGFTRDELWRMRIEILTAPGQRQPSEFLPTTQMPVRRTPLLYQVRKDGRVFPAEVAVGTYQVRGQLRGIYVARDITERRQAEEAEKLRQSEKMQREFVATVSHELRTPVAAIKGFAETLKLGGIEDVRNRLNFVTIIERHAQRLSKLIEDILELSALESGKRLPKPEPVLLPAFARKTARGLAPLLKKKRLSVRVAAPVSLRVSADRTMLAQVLQNLLSNAIKFSPVGERIMILAEACGDDALVAVVDRGPGIAPEHLPRIFERFNRASKDGPARAEGTGLGLSIVKQIVEAHRGRIWVESARGQGTRFRFTLPRALPRR